MRINHPLKAKKDVFHFSSYWRTWSRVLTTYVDGNGTLELNLTPVNPHLPTSWVEQVRPIIFRNHRTTLDVDDLLLEKLPDEVQEVMLNHLGVRLTQQLLETDWISLLDMPKVRRGKHGGGGLPFEECKLVGANMPLIRAHVLGPRG